MKINRSLVSPRMLPSAGIVALLAGCGGGGSGGASIGTGFVKWSDITPPDTVTVSGISTERSYSANAVTGEVTSTTDLGNSSSASTTITYRDDGSISALSIRTPSGTVSWDEANGDVIDDTGLIVTLADAGGTTAGRVGNPLALGWDYQSFGMWLTGIGGASGRFGGISVGAPTAGASIPVSGNPTFAGTVVGTYVSPTGEGYLTSADLSVDADFVNRSLEFTSSGTQKTSIDTAVQSPAANLNMTGTLTYAPATNGFSGTLTATGLSGPTTGRFYGPGAEELGGVFDLEGAGVEVYSGAYGASR